jgi:hypothetical protein
MKNMLFLAGMLVTLQLSAQDKSLPYYQIESTPEKFTAGAVAARLVDGLGFRFYWATEALRSQDLAYKPGADARTTEETIAHIYGMSVMIVNSTTKTINAGDKPLAKIPFEKMRSETLINLKKASEILSNASDDDLKSFKIMFRTGEKYAEYPFWNQLNGPIADCLWHVGQIVSFRRASGNPFTEKVSVFTGKVINN